MFPIDYTKKTYLWHLIGKFHVLALQIEYRKDIGGSDDVDACQTSSGDK